jgi:hypothetical protein
LNWYQNFRWKARMIKIFWRLVLHVCPFTIISLQTQGPGFYLTIRLFVFCCLYFQYFCIHQHYVDHLVAIFVLGQNLCIILEINVSKNKMTDYFKWYMWKPELWIALFVIVLWLMNNVCQITTSVCGPSLLFTM